MGEDHDDAISHELEDKIKQLEAEMELAQQDLLDSEEKWQRQIEEVQANPRNISRIEEDASMSEEEDGNGADNVATEMQKKMEAEREQMLCYVDRQESLKGISETDSETEEKEATATATIGRGSQPRKKNDVSHLTSMFETKLAPTQAPQPPVSASSSERFMMSAAGPSGTENQSKGSGDTSLTISQGKAMFEMGCSSTIASASKRAGSKHAMPRVHESNEVSANGDAQGCLPQPPQPSNPPQPPPPPLLTVESKTNNTGPEMLVCDINNASGYPSNILPGPNEKSTSSNAKTLKSNVPNTEPANESSSLKERMPAMGNGSSENEQSIKNLSYRNNPETNKCCPVNSEQGSNTKPLLPPKENTAPLPACSDEDIRQRRAVLMHGLKVKLDCMNEKNVFHEVNTVVSPVDTSGLEKSSHQSTDSSCNYMVSPLHLSEEEVSDQKNRQSDVLNDPILLQHEVKSVKPFSSAFSKKMKSYGVQLCQALKSSVMTVSTTLDRGRVCFGPYLACIANSVGALAMLCWINILRCASIVHRRLLDALKYISECKDDCCLMASLTPNAIKMISAWAASMDRGGALCCALLILSMFTGIYPTTPQSNVMVALLFLFFRIQPNRWQDTVRYHTFFLVLSVAISICIDIDWLSYKYFPNSLGKDADMVYHIEQDTSLFWTFQWYSHVMMIFLKLLLTNNTLKKSNNGNVIRKRFTALFAKCIIPSAIPENLSKAILDRVVALSWIELACSLLCFGYFFAIEFDVVNSLHFWSVPNQFVSLQGALLLKGASGFLVFLSLAKDVSKRDMLGLFGVRTEPRSTRRGRILSSGSSKCIALVKMIDFFVSILLWMSLVSAYRGFDAPKELSTFLGLIFSTQIVTSIVTPVLCAIVIWYVMLSRQQRHGGRGARQQAMEENTPINSSRKQRNRHSTPNMNQRPPHHHSAARISDEEASPEHDYNLNQHPSMSQTLFETRLTGASIQPASTLIQSNGLDLNITCKPHQFSAEWRRLPKGTFFSERINHIPTLSDCHKHFHSRRFFVVASGSSGRRGIAKIFVIAQRQRNALSRCLAEITFDSNRYEMNTEVRCFMQDETRFFMGALDLKKLFGF